MLDYINFLNCNDLVTGPVGKPAWPVKRKHVMASWNSHSGVHVFWKWEGVISRPGLGPSWVKLKACYYSCSSSCASAPYVPGLPTNISYTSKLRMTASSTLLPTSLTSEDRESHTSKLPNMGRWLIFGLYSEASSTSHSAVMFTTWMLPVPLPGSTFSCPPWEAKEQLPSADPGV